MEASNGDEKSAWLAAIQAHTEYFEASLLQQQAAAGDTAPALRFIQSTQSLAGGAAGDDDEEEEGEDGASMAQQLKRQSTASMPGGGRTQSVAGGGRGSVYSVVDDNKRWAIFLHPGEELVLAGLCGKPNPMGIHLTRQLVLTSRKRLAYIDPKTMELKGQIQWGAGGDAAFPAVKKVR